MRRRPEAGLPPPSAPGNKVFHILSHPRTLAPYPGFAHSVLIFFFPLSKGAAVNPSFPFTLFLE